jgi:hypothetical protein
MSAKILAAVAIPIAAAFLAVGGYHTFAQTSQQSPAKEAAEKDYMAAKWHKFHFKPEIDKVSDAQCLSCHQDILERKPRKVSPAGVKANETLAWYQALDTYAGAQENFHWRHISSPFAKQVMNLSCTFCHQGHDPREEAPGASATGPAQGTAAGFALRKVVDPSKTCLKCHGQFPAEIMQLPGPWHEVRPTMEYDDIKNGCLEACHQEAFRTIRHQVTYLKAKKIEELGKDSSDLCFGCHGGRAWYRNSFPYPRNPWPGMDEEVPDWAKDRPTQSDPRYRIEASTAPSGDKAANGSEVSDESKAK